MTNEQLKLCGQVFKLIGMVQGHLERCGDPAPEVKKSFLETTEEIEKLIKEIEWTPPTKSS